MREGTEPMVTKRKPKEHAEWRHHSPLRHVESEPVLEGSLPIEAGGYTLFGRSRAAAGTGFFIPELSWAFDAGVVAHNSRPEHVFLTHTHSDHIHQLVHMKSRHKPPQFYVPAHAVPLVEDFLNAAQTLSMSCPQSPEERALWTPSYQLNGVSPGDRIEIQRGGATFVVDVLGCDHSVPCVGYLVSQVRNKLKPEFHGLSGPEIGKLRQDGVEVTEGVSTRLFAFLGDTTTEAFVRHPELLETPAVICECSFLDSEHDVDRAEMTRHTSWAALQPLVEAHPQTLFVLSHFSLRYKPHEIRDFFAEVRRHADLPNLLLWLP